MNFTSGHALLIGVGTHQFHPRIDVPITVADAKAVATVLRDANFCGYPAQQVQLIQNQGATKAGILTALDELARQTSANDTVFLFYCGHGALGDDGNYYLVSHDAQLQKESGRVIAGTGVSEGELLAKLKAIQAQRAFLVFNACHSGNLSPSLDVETASLQTSSLSEETAAALLGTGQGRIIITACREQQFSYVGKGRNTIFTQALLDGLSGKGEVHNNRGFISAFSLYEQIYAAVTRQVQRQHLPTQEPELTVLKGVGPFAVALYKGASNLGNFAADGLADGQVVTEVEPEASAKLFRQRVIQTDGGAYTAGDVETGSGDFTGRDETVHGDKTHGDKFGGDKVRGNKVDGVSIGNVTGGIHGSVIAGRDAKQTTSTTSGAATPGETELQ